MYRDPVSEKVLVIRRLAQVVEITVPSVYDMRTAATLRAATTTVVNAATLLFVPVPGNCSGPVVLAGGETEIVALAEWVGTAGTVGRT